jgi:uncharacterized protein (DUF1015 family)
MAKISPFRAIRPTRDKVHLVAAKPVYTYKKIVLEAKLVDNPFTFLHIVSPDFGNNSSTKLSGEERFNLISERYQAFIDNGVFIQDEVPTLYIYRQTQKRGTFTGVICGASIDEYKEGLIKKHEATITSREELFTNYLNVVGYNAEPVLLSHSPSAQISELIEKCTDDRAEYEFSTTDLIKHELWPLSTSNAQLVQAAFEKIPELYIADGHHRSASSVGLTDTRCSNEVNYANEKNFLAYLIDENQLQIVEFNRLVKSLNGYSPDELLDALSSKFTIKEIEQARNPLSEHEITVCMKGKWYTMSCMKHIIDLDHPVKCLDAEILTEHILTPLLGIQDLKLSKDILFMSGAEPLSKLENKVAFGDYAIAFVLYPITINDLIMPPKSTWVEPKLRSGLTIYNINE